LLECFNSVCPNDHIGAAPPLWPPVLNRLFTLASKNCDPRAQGHSVIHHLLTSGPDGGVRFSLSSQYAVRA